MRPALATPLLVLLAACSGGSDGRPEPPLEPPPDTGGQAIDMQGQWVATAVEILEQVGGVADPPAAPNGLFPPVVGSTFTIGPLGFLDLDGTDATTMCTPDEFLERFAAINQQDGRFAVLDIGCRTRPDPRIADGGTVRLQCAFGSVGQNEMLGYVRAVSATAPRPAHVPSLGLYRVAIRRR